jgi:hypothetical protein
VLTNYTITYNTASFSITPKAASVTPDAKTKVYGSADPALTGTLFGFLAADGVTATYSRTAGETVLGGPYTISATLSPAGVLTNYTITYNTASFSITPKAASVTANNKTMSYGDAIPPLDATVTGTVNGDTLNYSLSTTATSSSDAGSYPIMVTLGNNPNYSVTPTNGTLTINPGIANVAYIGQTLFVTSGSSSTTAQVTLSASVLGSSGLISTAKVEFWDITPGRTPTLLAGNVPVSPVNGSTSITGTANTIVTLSTGKYGEQDYLIEVRVTGNYTNTQQTSAPANTSPYMAAHPTVTVMQPATSNTIKASGEIAVLPTSAGTFGTGIIGNVHYSVALQYNKGGTNPQGQILIWYDRIENGTTWTYYIKSNSLSSISITPASGTPTGATVYTKSSIFKINKATGATVSVDGNVSLRMDVADGKYTTTSQGDQIAFTVLSSKTGELYYANNWQYDPTILGWRCVLQDIYDPNNPHLGVVIT